MSKPEQYSVLVDINTGAMVKVLDFYNVNNFVVDGEAFAKMLSDQIAKTLGRDGGDMERYGIEVVKAISSS